MGEATCCCCIQIRAGVIILAVLGLIAGGYNSFKGAAAIVNGLENDPSVIQLRSNIETAKYAEVYISVAKPLGVYYTIHGIFGFIMAIFLLMGASDRNIRYLKLWVKIKCIVLGISIFTLVGISVAFMVVIPGAGIMMGIMSLFFGLGALTISAYYIGVVHRYSGVLVEEQNSESVKEKV